MSLYLFDPRLRQICTERCLLPSSDDEHCGHEYTFQSFLVLFEKGAYKFGTRDGPLEERLGTPRNFTELGLFCFDAATLLVLFCLLVFFVLRVIRDSGQPFKQRLRRERWFWALQKTLTQSYIQFVPFFLLLAALDEYVIVGNFFLRTTREAVLLLWAFLLTNSWTLALDPLGRTFLVVQPIRYYGLRFALGLTAVLGGWALSLSLLDQGGGEAQDLAHQARDSVVIVRVWLCYLSTVTVLGALYAAYQLYIFKVLRRTIMSGTRGLFIKRGDFDSGILLALVEAQRNTPARMPGLPRKVLRQLRLELEARALRHLEVVTALILLNAAAKLTVLGLQLYLVEMALPEDSKAQGLGSPGAVGFAQLALHCVSLRLLNFLCAVLEALPMGYFLACLRTPVCPVAEILIPYRRRARLPRAASNQTIIYQKVAKFLGFGAELTASNDTDEIVEEGEDGETRTRSTSFLTTMEMMNMSGVVPPAQLTPPLALSAFLSGAEIPELERPSTPSSVASSPQTRETTHPRRNAVVAVAQEGHRQTDDQTHDDPAAAAAVSSQSSHGPLPQGAPSPRLDDLFYAFHGLSTPEAVAVAKSAVLGLPFWEFCRSRDLPRRSKNAEPALLRPSWYSDVPDISQTSQKDQQQEAAENKLRLSRPRTSSNDLKASERSSTVSVARSSTASSTRSFSVASSVVCSSASSLASEKHSAKEIYSGSSSLTSDNSSTDVSCFAFPRMNTEGTKPVKVPKQRRHKRREHPTEWVELDIALMEMVLFHRSKNLAIGALFTGQRSFVVVNTRSRRTHVSKPLPAPTETPSENSEVGHSDASREKSLSVDGPPPSSRESSSDDEDEDDFEDEMQEQSDANTNEGRKYRSISTLVGDEITRWVLRDSFSISEQDNRLSSISVKKNNRLSSVSVKKKARARKSVPWRGSEESVRSNMSMALTAHDDLDSKQNPQAVARNGGIDSMTSLGNDDASSNSAAASSSNPEHTAAAAAAAATQDNNGVLSRRYEWRQWIERGRSDVASPDATDPHFSLTSLVPQPKQGEEMEIRLDIYNIDPHNRSAFDEIAVERELLEDHVLLATTSFNFNSLKTALPPISALRAVSSSPHDCVSSELSRGLMLVQDPASPPSPLVHTPLCVRGYFNKHGNRWQRVGGIAEVSARFLKVNPWSMGTFQSPHPLGIITRGFSLPTAEEDMFYSRENFLGLRQEMDVVNDHVSLDGPITMRGGVFDNDDENVNVSTMEDGVGGVFNDSFDGGDIWGDDKREKQQRASKRSSSMYGDGPEHDVLMRPFDNIDLHANAHDRDTNEEQSNKKPSTSSPRPPRRLLAREEMFESPFSLVVPKLMLRLATFDRRKDAQQCHTLIKQLNAMHETTTTHSVPPTGSPLSQLEPIPPEVENKSGKVASSDPHSSLLPPISGMPVPRLSVPSVSPSSSPSKPSTVGDPKLSASVRRRLAIAQEWLTDLADQYSNLATSTDSLYTEMSNGMAQNSNKEWGFKKSSAKTSASLRFHPTNLHLQVMVVTAPSSIDREFSGKRNKGRQFSLDGRSRSSSKCMIPKVAKALEGETDDSETPGPRPSPLAVTPMTKTSTTTVRSFETTTVGCFAAHALKLNKGPSGAGVFQLRQHLALRLRFLEGKHERLLESCKNDGVVSGGAEIFLAVATQLPPLDPENYLPQSEPEILAASAKKMAAGSLSSGSQPQTPAAVPLTRGLNDGLNFPPPLPIRRRFHRENSKDKNIRRSDDSERGRRSSSCGRFGTASGSNSGEGNLSNCENQITGDENRSMKDDRQLEDDDYGSDDDSPSSGEFSRFSIAGVDNNELDDDDEEDDDEDDDDDDDDGDAKKRFGGRHSITGGGPTRLSWTKNSSSRSSTSAINHRPRRRLSKIGWTRGSESVEGRSSEVGGGGTRSATSSRKRPPPRVRKQRSMDNGYAVEDDSKDSNEREGSKSESKTSSSVSSGPLPSQPPRRRRRRLLFKGSKSTEKKNVHEIEANGNPLWAGAEPPPPLPPRPRGWLPTGWKRHIDPRTGDPFYSNGDTQETSWSAPIGSGLMPEDVVEKDEIHHEIGAAVAASTRDSVQSTRKSTFDDDDGANNSGKLQEFGIADAGGRPKVGTSAATHTAAAAAAERELSSLPPDRKLHELEFKLRQRTDVVFSQAIASVATAVAYRLEVALGGRRRSSTAQTQPTPQTELPPKGNNPSDGSCSAKQAQEVVDDDVGQNFDKPGGDDGGGDEEARELLTRMHRVGLLLSFESLLSTTGKEAAMLSDFYGTVLELRHLSVMFRPFKEEQVAKYLPSSNTASPQQDKETKVNETNDHGSLAREKAASGGANSRSRSSSVGDDLGRDRVTDESQPHHECVFVEMMAGNGGGVAGGGKVSPTPPCSELIQAIALVRNRKNNGNNKVHPQTHPQTQTQTPYQPQQDQPRPARKEGRSRFHATPFDDESDEGSSGGELEESVSGPRQSVNNNYCSPTAATEEEEEEEEEAAGLILVFLLHPDTFALLPEELKGRPSKRTKEKKRGNDAMRVKSAFNDHGGGGDTKDKETHGDSVGGGGGGGGDHDDGGLVRLYPVMFSQGINEQQTFANAMGFSGFQEAINLAGVVGLRQYLERLSRYWEEEKGAEEGGAEGGAGVDVTRTQVLPQLPEQGKVEDTRKHLWEKLRALERRVEEARGSKAKHFEVLTESSMLARSMGGLRFTSCKSAKDRTGMSVTLEQARLLRTHYALSAETCAKATHLMRLHGTRLANAHKNIGRPTYAFNGLQLQMLPRAYRPPVVVAGKAAS